MPGRSAESKTPRARLFEVSLRDGLQNEDAFVPTDLKMAHLDGLVAAGFRDIEVTSFVNPRWVPQLADAAEVAARLPDHPGVRYWALVPNQRGLERAIDAEIEHIATVLSASETHNKKNLNRTIAESLGGLRKVIAASKAEGAQVRSYISTAFGCPWEGDVPVAKVAELGLALLDAGADLIALGDTTGLGHPSQVQEIVAELVEAGIPIERLCMHFHDTRGTALACVWAAWQVGVRNFDGSIAGTGGCPYAAGASGNLASEDLVNLFDRMNVETGVDLDAACRAGLFMEEALGRPLPGRTYAFWKGRQAKLQAARSA